MGEYTVYMHVNLLNKKKYIGITSLNVNRRWGSDGNGYKTQTFFRAIEKYGWNNFEHKIIYTGLTEQDALSNEIELISKYKTNDSSFGYNMTTGGEENKKLNEASKRKIGIANSKRIVSLETRAKMSRNKKGTTLSQESRRKLSENKKGWIPSEQTKKKMSDNHADVSGKNNPMYGKVFTEEHRVNISNSLKGKKFTKERRERLKGKTGELSHVSRKVVQLSMDGKFIKEYVSITEAASKTGAIRQHISKCCKGERKSTGGYKWIYNEQGVS